jgi:hypothetical protein
MRKCAFITKPNHNKLRLEKRALLSKKSQIIFSWSNFINHALQVNSNSEITITLFKVIQTKTTFKQIKQN